MTLSLETDLNPCASSIGLDMEAFCDDTYDPAVGPICGRKWSKVELSCAPYAHVPIHESPEDYLRLELIYPSCDSEDEEEDDDTSYASLEMDDLDRAEEDRQAFFDKYLVGDEEDLLATSDMTSLYGSTEYYFDDHSPSEDWDDEEDDGVIEDPPKNPAVPNDKYSMIAKRLLFEDDIDEDIIGTSLPPCIGSRKAVRIAHGGEIPHERGRQYSDRGRKQISFRTGYVSHL